MAINDISLTAGMKSNLISLQNTAKLLDRTQTRLSTGKRVNSVVDDPVNFFAAQNHMIRASDLAALKDAMGEAVQTITSANTGITSISAVIEAAKGLLFSASTVDPADRADYVTQYNVLMDQIDYLALDSGYKGINLLDSDNLTVEFNEGGSSDVTVTGFDASATGLALVDATTLADAEITTLTGLLNTALTDLRTQAAGLSTNLGIITIRQDFTTKMINTLTTGADNLTLADMNEEGANMLMLQTRQQLGLTALNLSAEAAQSIIMLFQ